MRLAHLLVASHIALFASACGGGGSASTPVTQLTQAYDAEVGPAFTLWRHATWRAHTQVVEGDDGRAREAQAAWRAWRDLASHGKWARQAKEVADALGDDLTQAQAATLNALRVSARREPSTDASLLDQRDLHEGAHQRLRLRTRPALDGLPISHADLAERYANAIDIDERAHLWLAGTEHTGRLKASYLARRDLHNQVAQKGGWSHHLDRELETYQMDVGELDARLRSFRSSLAPLYQELHTWARHELAARTGEPVPAQLPAHWLPTPLGRDWSGMVELEGSSISENLAGRGASRMLRDIEEVYVSWGLEPLPESFWERSSFYPADARSGLGKTVAPSAWDMNLQGDVRVLLSTQAQERDRRIAVREFGFAHALLERHLGGLPTPLRQRPPGALQGALGYWADILTTRADHLEAQALVDTARTDMPSRLQEALAVIPWLQFLSAVAIPWEIEVYTNDLSEAEVNARFWALMERGMGIVPPEARTDRTAEALLWAPFHDLPGQSFQPLFASLLAWQLHVHAANEQGVDPFTADLRDQASVGEAMRQLARREGLDPIDAVTRDLVGAPLSAQPLETYFSPLSDWLTQQNDGRSATFTPR